MIWRRANPEWRPEPGPGYELRQYQGGRPTGLVAIVGWDHDAARCPSAVGPDVRLTRQHLGLLIEELRRQGGGAAVRLQIPLRSCVDAQITAEPGLPGAALIRLTLTVRIGAQVAFPLSLWFPPTCHPFLQSLVNEFTDRARSRSAAPTPEDLVREHSEPTGAVPVLPLLAVSQAPDDADWVVFRPADDGEVLLRRPAQPATSGGERS